MENGPSEAGADDEEEEGEEAEQQPRKISPSEHSSHAEAQAAEHEAEVTGVRSTATDTGNCAMSRKGVGTSVVWRGLPAGMCSMVSWGGGEVSPGFPP